LKKILSISFVLLILSIIPSSFGWDGQMAMNADKRNVERGQIISYEGYIYGDRPIDGEIISIIISEKETKKIILTAETTPEPNSVEYFGNTSWPFIFKVDTSYKEIAKDKTYVVEAKYDDKSTKLEFFIQNDPGPTCLEILGDSTIMVFTDKEKYDKGDVIRVSGCLSGEATNKETNIIVYDPNGKKIGVNSLILNPDRTFSEEFFIDERFGINGTYSVEVDAGGIYSSTKSFVVPEFGLFSLLFLGIAFAMVLIFSKKSIIKQNLGNYNIS